jgi:hypothetical protein
VDNLTKVTGGALSFDVYSIFPTDIVMWTEGTKGSRLHRGVESDGRITEQTRLATLSGASNVFTRTVYMEANNAVTGTVMLQAKPVLSTSAATGSDTVKITAIDFGLTPYTPQTQYIVPMEIPEANWKENGVGIRRNGDYDSGNTLPDWSLGTATSQENDLIRLDIAVSTATGIEYKIRTSATAPNVRLWDSALKGGYPVHTVTSGSVVAASKTVYAEYTSSGNAAVTFELVAILTATGQELYTEEIVFQPFNSMIVVLGGEFQVPNDPVNSPGNHGIFDWAIARYREGYNVYMYDEDDCSGYGVGATYNDIVNSINNHRIQNIAIAGYSHGGGSTYGLSWRLNENVAGRLTDITRSFNVVLTAYIDAVQDYTASPETRRPLLSQSHVNFYQLNSWHLYGGATVAVPAVGTTENHHIDPNGSLIGHGNIDDDLFVLQTLEARLKLRIPFANR